MPPDKQKIWIDLENTPHIPFFQPIIEELETRGYEVVLTARDAYQTCEMARRQGMSFTQIGRHYGRKRFMKLLGLGVRCMQLIPFILREKPVLGLNHGARGQILACNLLRIPTVMLMDYEHSSAPPMVRPTWEIVPEVLPDDGLHCRNRGRIRKYSGIKEDVYVSRFKPDPAIISALQLNGDTIVTVRPPATEAHYHNSEAEILFERFMDRVCRTDGVRAVVLPRNTAQDHAIRAGHPEWFADSKAMIPDQVVDGLNLLWHSDLVVSGGGTMNREAAALGVPVYSIFRGRIGAVDRALQAQGRLTMIESVDEIESAIRLEPRNKEWSREIEGSAALSDIIAHLEEIVGNGNRPG